jgi:O-antigen/teichoic acid export membrane protein
MQLPALLMTQVVSAAGVLVLPTLAQDFGISQSKRLEGKAILVSLGLSMAGLLFVGFLGLGSTRIEHLVFEGKYSSVSTLMPVLALVPAAAGFGTGYSMALRASQQPKYDLYANGVAAMVAVISALSLTNWWGITGAAVSMVVAYVALDAAIVFFFYRSRGNRHDSVL